MHNGVSSEHHREERSNLLKVGFICNDNSNISTAESLKTRIVRIPFDRLWGHPSTGSGTTELRESVGVLLKVALPLFWTLSFPENQLRELGNILTIDRRNHGSLFVLIPPLISYLQSKMESQNQLIMLRRAYL